MVSSSPRVNDQCRYGYLRPDDTDKEDVFVQETELRELGTLRSGDRCEFRVAMVNGRERAQDVTGVDGFTGYDYEVDPRTRKFKKWTRRGGDGRDVPDF